jgi:hypothetical protein
VQEPIVEHDAVSGRRGHGHLALCWAERRIVEVERVDGAVSGPYGDGVERRGAEMRSRQQSKASVLPVDVGEVAEDGDLRRAPLEADRVIPAPPILVPPERSAAWLFDAEVRRDPTQIRSTNYSFKAC